MALLSRAILPLALLLWTFISCASGDPVTNHSANLCIWKGQCGSNPEHQAGTMNCYYNGPPVTATKGDDLFSLIEANCPWYIDQTNNSTASVCCGADQVLTLQTQVKLAQELLSRCPACYKNFMRHFCATTCDPSQALFMNPTMFSPSPLNASVTAVEEVMTYVTSSYANNLYDSCKDVEFSQQSGKVISLLCGTPQCNPPTWLRFMGDPSQNPLTPFLIGYTFVDDPTNTSGLPPGVQPFDVPLYRCNDSDPSIQCTCADCISACPAPIPETIYADRLWVFGVGMAAAGVFLTLVFFFAALIGMCVTLAKGQPVANGEVVVDDDDEKKPILDDSTTIQQTPKHKVIRNGCCACTLGARFENAIKWVFYKWGKFASEFWYLVCLVCLILSGVMCFGMFFFTVTTDPVQLWSAPTSRARLEKDYYDQNFNPFYRTEQIIITTKNVSNYTVDFYTGNTQDLIFTMGPVFQMEVLQEVLKLQLKIQNMKVPYTNPNGMVSNITLKDVCFAPIENTYINNCTIQSVLNYFQNSLDNLNMVEYDSSGFYLIGNASTHIHYCVRNPSAPLDGGVPLPCLGGYGGPVNPDVVLGGFTDFDEEGNPNYDSAKAMLVTFLLNNHLSDEDNGMALAWEQKFLEIVQSFNESNPYINISYSSERSITNELNRESDTDILTVAISYVLMFVYITIFLGHIRSIYTIFVDTKLVVGLFGVLLVLVAVVASLGFYSYLHVTATLIVLEVVPFLVLAVGVDNLFILVHSYERQQAKAPSESTVELIGRAVGDVAPSLILTALSETSAFMLGAASSMPAVRTFSLFAGTAVFFNFLLQVTVFVSIMYLDAERQKQNRVDVFFCIQLDKKTTHGSCDIGPVKCDTGFLKLIMKYYSKFLLSPVVRPFVILFFGLLVSGSLGMITEIEVGLDQTVALPKDSYLMSYFYCLNKYLHTGAPVYFVVKGGFDYTTQGNQNKMCAISGCNKDSLGTQITLASRQSDYTRIAQPPSSWMDTYLQWIPPTGQCCGYDNDTLNECYQPGNGSCLNCIGTSRPSAEEFTKYLRWFLLENPGLQCATGGHAAFNASVKFGPDGKTVVASNVMTYHTILTTSSEYISALSQARKLADNISVAMGVEVFPYSVFYVYYEQYLTIIGDFYLNIGLSLAAVFVMTIVLMGFNVWAATIILSVVLLVIVNMLGYFWLLQINANAVSLVNLVMTVGIAVEFCAHIVRWYCSSELETRVERARSALEEMGSSVVSGITITKFLGVFVLLFAKSQIFEVYYFRMYMMMLLFGFLHGLVFLPVLLSYVGPPRSTILPPPWGSTPRTTSANGHTNDTANSAASVGADTKKVKNDSKKNKKPQYTFV